MRGTGEAGDARAASGLRRRGFAGRELAGRGDSGGDRFGDGRIGIGIRLGLVCSMRRAGKTGRARAMAGVLMAGVMVGRTGAVMPAMAAAIAVAAAIAATTSPATASTGRPGRGGTETECRLAGQGNDRGGGDEHKPRDPYQARIPHVMLL